MMYLGQLLDTINNNELLIIRSSNERAITLVDEMPAHELKRIITKEGRQRAVGDIYSDISERNKSVSVTVIYVRNNGYLLTTE